MRSNLGTLAVLSFMFFAMFQNSDPSLTSIVDGPYAIMGVGPFASKMNCEVIGRKLGGMMGADWTFLGCKAIQQ